MVFVEGGSFMMGNENYDIEKPIHQVTLTSYYIGQFQVTQALWNTIMPNNPSRFKGDTLPVESVSYDDCNIFIKKLNEITGKHFRLPTEAEWEFAARGGTKSKGYKYSGSNNIEEIAWYGKDYSSGKIHPVGKKKPNELGIYDMSGNVWEWCQDWFGSYLSINQTNPIGPNIGTYREYRGGCWYSLDYECSPTHRSMSYSAGLQYLHIGLRLVLLP
ncbi:formylglycine-generating enzyme family protein [Bacteroides intestinalis]|nr:SUMF1/EgtB/PvdO family nonheme iron enzyme [Bacteroides intestinalis]